LSKTKNEILEKLKSLGRPLNLDELQQELSIEKKNLRKVLRSMIISGDIVKLKSGKYAKTDDLNLHTGYVDGHPDGYAFFVPEKEDMQDLFIPPKRLNGAVHKDRVAIKIEKFKGKEEAHVVKILERGFKRIVGRVEKSKYFAYVVPFVKKFYGDIYIPNRFSKKLKTDDVVVAEIIQYPEKGKNAEGKIAKKLGALSDKGIENKIVMEKYEYKRKFPKDVTKELHENSKALFENPGERKDLTELFTVTIDGESARDFDDAISIQNNKSGGYKLYVHIADVAHFVQPDTDLDKEAYNRATSVYFPEFAIPMLPEKLSNDLCSLKPRVKRLTLTAEIDYDSYGNRVSSDIYQSVIRSNYRLTYDIAYKYITKEEIPKNKKLSKLLDESAALAELLIKRRRKQGTIDFDLPEVEFLFDDNGDLYDLKPLERNVSHRLIEHFMIEANEAVSEFLEKKLDISIFRVHDSPDPAKIEEFVQTCKRFGVDVKTPDEITPKNIQRISSLIENSRFSYILSSLLVRTMQKAVYSTENIGHFGLASESYTHFTSPIRRYPDMIVHRLLKMLLYNYNFKPTKSFMNDAAEHSSVMEKQEEDAEREIRQYKKLRFLETHVDDVFDCHINRVASSGIFVFLPKMLLTGFLPISGIDDDYYVFDPEKEYLVGKNSKKMYRIGDVLQVSVDRINYDYLEVDFKLA